MLNLTTQHTETYQSKETKTKSKKVHDKLDKPMSDQQNNNKELQGKLICI